MRLPDFLVLGLPKCGTTSLHLTLKKHPEICMPLQKETRFFDQNFDKGIEWYKEKFWHCPADKKIGEVTTTVFFVDDFARHLKQVLPMAKFIVLLRDPIERLISHYWHNVRVGGEKLSLKQALKQEKSRAYKNRESYSWFAYSGIGERYKQYLETLYSVFDKEKVMIVLLEELLEDKRKMDEIFSFIGVKPLGRELVRAHIARMPRNRFLQKILDLPSRFFYTVQECPLVQQIVSQSFKRRTRLMRSKIGYSLSKFSEISQKEFKKPSLPLEIRKNLEQRFSQKLKGLDKLTSKDLTKYWPWYGK